MLRTRIKEARKLLKLSQAALGKLARLTGAEISRIECGYRDVSAAEVAALARALGLKEEKVQNGPGISANPVAAGSVVEIIPAATSQPSGSDLDDPENFREMPDLGLLNPGELDRSAFRAQLIAASTWATKILHTSRVPAAIWVAWRDFDREVQRILRSLPPG